MILYQKFYKEHLLVIFILMKYRPKYLKRAIKGAGYLRFVPFIRMLGLNGSMVRGEEKQTSDIDLLLVVKKNRLYTARFFATILTELTGYRRKGNKSAGRLCLNCYLSDENLKIAPVNPKSRKKVAGAYKRLIALIDDNDYETRFFRKNKWFNRYKVSGRVYNENLREKLEKYFPLRPKKWGERALSGKFGDWLENKLMDYQVRRIMAGKKKGDEIVCERNEIRLHPKKN